MSFDYFISALTNIIGEECLVTDKASLAAALRAPYAQKSVENWPLALVAPLYESQVSDVLRICHKNGIKVRARGTGSKAGIENYIIPEPWIMLAMTRMNRILEIDRKNLQVTAQAGATTGELDKRLKAENLVLRGLGTSGSVGGLFASARQTCMSSSSLLAQTRKLKICLADGVRLICPAPVLTSKSLFLQPAVFYGSEGALAVITEATFNLSPAPEHEKFFAAQFPDNFAAAKVAASLFGHMNGSGSLNYLDQACSEILGIGNQAVVCGALGGSLEKLDQFSDLLEKLIKQENGVLSNSAAALQKYEELPAAFASRTDYLEPFALHCLPQQLPALVEAAQQIQGSSACLLPLFGSLLTGQYQVVFLSREIKEKAGKALLALQLVLNGAMTSESEQNLTPEEWLGKNPVYEKFANQLKQMFDPGGILSE